MTARISDGRTSARQKAHANRARLEWVEGGVERESPARLVNLGGTGALFVAETPPPLRQTVWCRLEGPSATDWVEASVVRHGGTSEVGVSFRASCPYDFTLAATLGISFDSFFQVIR